MTAICRALLPVAAGFIIVPVRSHRSSTPEELVKILHTLDASVTSTTATDLAHALKSQKAPGIKS